MLDAIRSFFQSSMSPEDTADRPDDQAPDLRLAAAALLLELAYADDSFTAEERAHLESAIARHFGLEPEEASRLLELADKERRQAVDLWQFTSLIDKHYSLGQKTLLAEVMWGLIYADGTLVEKEHYLMRKISGLLHIKPGYLAEARRRVGEPPKSDGHDSN